MGVGVGVGACALARMVASVCEYVIKVSHLGLSRSLEVVGQETTQCYFMQHGGMCARCDFSLSPSLASDKENDRAPRVHRSRCIG